MLKFWNYLSVLAENKERFLAKTAVAPLAGAWIEIRRKGNEMTFDDGSLPSRERGLKSETGSEDPQSPKSLPSRERGLKFSLTRLLTLQHGRSPRGSVD